MSAAEERFVISEERTCIFEGGREYMTGIKREVWLKSEDEEKRLFYVSDIGMLIQLKDVIEDYLEFTEKQERRMKDEPTDSSRN
jgi:hypothetical protein